MKRIFVTGIGTGVGKTLVSAILVEALKADYWKPVQAGSLDHTDTDIVKELVSNERSNCFPETYRLTQPMSPHAAAERDGINIELDNISLPSTNNILIIEGAGGLMVPLNSEELVIDLISKFQAEVILVSKIYLGNINHTLLSIEALKKRDLNLTGIIFNGNQNEETEQFILDYSNVNCLGRIENENEINQETVKKYAANFEDKF